MTNTPPVRARALILVLALLAAFPPLATDMYLPAFSGIEAHLGAAPGDLEFSLAVFFLGLGIGQLIIGPSIDRLGRRGPLIAGVVIYCAASILIPTVDDVAAFTALRFVQAIGASAGMVVGRAVLSDLYSGREAARAMTVLVMTMTLGPIVSPLAGSLLTSVLPWQSVFLAMFAVGLAALALTLAIVPETLPPSRRVTISPIGLARRYAGLLARFEFILPLTVASLIQAAMFAFITASSSVLMGVFGLSRIAFGVAFGIVALALVVGGQINHRLLRHTAIHHLLDRGLPLFVLAGALLLAVSGTSHLAVLIVPVWLAVACVGALSANAMSLAMATTRGAAGTGSAVLGAVQFSLAFLCSTLVGAAIDTPVRALALGVFVPALLAALLWFAGRLTSAGRASAFEAR
ncbi:multidrug effflux MFS transporter [Acuticoccus kandeliae]|uniref:multidrug effflux MFS transporter n=1 Tax=Acuticoccus kandeliae TaxID=2073160 RepID=UPI00130069C7|nr:multidrug effflux MFS transporter [Acuticoccus kandeliae]